jgi:Fuc2NAc and GlcNAc transferase
MMADLIWPAIALTVVLTLIGVPALIRFAPRLGLIDVPNARSSHAVPVPRAAGVALIAGVLGAGTFLFAAEGWPFYSFTCLCLAGLVVGGIGLADDRTRVSARMRFVFHWIAAVGALAFILEQHSTALSVVSVSLLLGLAFCLVWALNLYNFMDGIDGLALLESVFLAIGLWWLLRGTGSPWLVLLPCIAAGAFSALLWNWAPARIFLGDSGSGFLGFLLAVIAADAIVAGQLHFATAVILWGVFLIDASVTLLRRIWTGQTWRTAHRSHAYQRLARRLESHAAVSLGALAINVFWLWPWALLAERELASPTLCVLGALAPLVLGAWRIGAGLPDILPAAHTPGVT